MTISGDRRTFCNLIASSKPVDIEVHYFEVDRSIKYTIDSRKINTVVYFKIFKSDGTEVKKLYSSSTRVHTSKSEAIRNLFYILKLTKNYEKIKDELEKFIFIN